MLMSIIMVGLYTVIPRVLVLPPGSRSALALFSALIVYSGFWHIWLSGCYPLHSPWIAQVNFPDGTVATPALLPAHPIPCGLLIHLFPPPPQGLGSTYVAPGRRGYRACFAPRIAHMFSAGRRGSDDRLAPGARYSLQADFSHFARGFRKE